MGSVESNYEPDLSGHQSFFGGNFVIRHRCRVETYVCMNSGQLKIYRLDFGHQPKFRPKKGNNTNFGRPYFFPPDLRFNAHPK